MYEYLQLLLKIQFDWESTCLFSSNPRSRKRDHNWQNTLLLYLEPLSPRQHQSMWKAFYEKKKKQKKHTVSLMRGFISQSEHRKKHQTQRALTCYLSPYSPIAHIDSFWLLFFFPPLVVQKCLKNVQHGGQNSQIRATKSKRCTGGAESVRMNVNERQNYGKAQNALCSVTDAQGDNFFYHGNVSALKIHLTELFPLHMFITACS